MPLHVCVRIDTVFMVFLSVDLPAAVPHGVYPTAPPRCPFTRGKGLLEDYETSLANSFTIF